MPSYTRWYIAGSLRIISTQKMDVHHFKDCTKSGMWLHKVYSTLQTIPHSVCHAGCSQIWVLPAYVALQIMGTSGYGGHGVVLVGGLEAQRLGCLARQHLHMQFECMFLVGKQGNMAPYHLQILQMNLRTTCKYYKKPRKPWHTETATHRSRSLHIQWQTVGNYCPSPLGPSTVYLSCWEVTDLDSAGIRGFPDHGQPMPKKP